MARTRQIPGCTAHLLTCHLRSGSESWRALRSHCANQRLLPQRESTKRSLANLPSDVEKREQFACAATSTPLAYGARNRPALLPEVRLRGITHKSGEQLALSRPRNCRVGPVDIPAGLFLLYSMRQVGNRKLWIRPVISMKISVLYVVLICVRAEGRSPRWGRSLRPIERLNDPSEWKNNEWKNIAGEPRQTGLKRELAQWMPKRSVPPVPGRNDYDFDFDSYTFRRK